MKNGDYTLVVAPTTYPGKLYRGRYCYEHRLQYWLSNGTLPEIVHHKDKNRLNNLPDNLESMKMRGHSQHHLIKPLVKIECKQCGKVLMLKNKTYRAKLKNKMGMFCSQSCSATYQFHR